MTVSRDSGINHPPETGPVVEKLQKSLAKEQKHDDIGKGEHGFNVFFEASLICVGIIRALAGMDGDRNRKA